MINFFDYHAVEAIAEARRARFLSEAEELRRARLLRAGSPRRPSRVRRAVGIGLIRTGAWVSGRDAVEARGTLATTH